MITTALPKSPEVTQLRNGLWTATVDHVTSTWHAHPEDKRTPRQHRPLTEQSRRWALVLGTTDVEIEVYVVRERHTTTAPSWSSASCSTWGTTSSANRRELTDRAASRSSRGSSDPRLFHLH